MPELFVKKAGKYSQSYPTTGTPFVSRTSNDFPMSRIDLIPAQTTVTGVLPNSSKSADISILVSAPLCTPPIPPVANTCKPAKCAKIIVPDTVVAALALDAQAYAKSLRDAFKT